MRLISKSLSPQHSTWVNAVLDRPHQTACRYIARLQFSAAAALLNHKYESQAHPGILHRWQDSLCWLCSVPQWDCLQQWGHAQPHPLRQGREHQPRGETGHCPGGSKSSGSRGGPKAPWSNPSELCLHSGAVNRGLHSGFSHGSYISHSPFQLSRKFITTKYSGLRKANSFFCLMSAGLQIHRKVISHKFKGWFSPLRMGALLHNNAWLFK